MFGWLRNLIQDYRERNMKPVGGFSFAVWEVKREDHAIQLGLLDLHISAGTINPIWLGVNPFDAMTPYMEGKTYFWTLNVQNEAFAIRDPRNYKGNIYLTGASFPFGAPSFPVGPRETGFVRKHSIWTEGIPVAEWVEIARPPLDLIQEGWEAINARKSQDGAK